MEIEADCVEFENPYERARIAFEELVVELSSLESHELTNSDLETLINKDGFEIMRLLLQGHLDERGPNETVSPVVNSVGTVLPYKRERGRWLESIFGRVWVNRIGYEAKGERLLCPLDGDLNLPKEVYSLGVRKRVAMEAVKNSFDEVVAAVSTTTGAHVPKRQSEKLVALAANDFESFYDPDLAIRESEASGPILVLSVDGKGVVMREEDLRKETQKVAQKQKLASKLSKGEKKGKKRMATVASVYSIEPFERTPEQVEATVGAASATG